MAKKKTAEKAKIEAIPVLRVEPTPDPEETSTTKSYAVRDDWKDKGIVNIVAFKSVDGEVQDLTVNGEPAGGGGGGGDLGTAEVTFDVSVDNYPEWYGCATQAAMPPIFPNDCSAGTILGNSGTVTVITYKGCAQLRPSSTSGIRISVTGSAQLGEFGTVYVTGSCTIIISADENV